MHVNGKAKQADDRISSPGISQAVRGNSDLPARAWGAASTIGPHRTPPRETKAMGGCPSTPPTLLQRQRERKQCERWTKTYSTGDSPVIPHQTTKGVSSNGANRPKLQTWPNVAPFGQPGIGGWVELQNLGVTVQK